MNERRSRPSTFSVATNSAAGFMLAARQIGLAAGPQPLAVIALGPGPGLGLARRLEAGERSRDQAPAAVAPATCFGAEPRREVAGRPRHALGLELLAEQRLQAGE